MAQGCPIHRMPYLDGYAIRIGGFQTGRLFAGYFQAMRARFPHANAVKFGSCVDRSSGVRKKVKYCMKCREELRAWYREWRSSHEEPGGFMEMVDAHLSDAGE